MADDPGKEMFARLFKDEEHFIIMPPKYISDACKIDIRSTALQHIEKLYPRTTHGFDHLIPYMAMTNFDRWYSTHDYFPNVLETTDDTKNRELFVICCLTISWKLADNAFDLETFLGSEKNIVYSLIDVRDMELEIKNGLEGRMETVSPFIFVGFFSPYFGMSLDDSVFHDLIYRSQRDIEFTAYRASVIALSAMLAVATEMDSVEHRNYVLQMINNQFGELLPIEDSIEQCRIRLVPVYKNQNPADSLGPQSSDQSTNLDDPPDGTGPLSHPSTDLEPGQTSAGIVDPPAGPSGQTSVGSSETPPAAATERPRQRSGKEHVADSGHDGQNADTKPGWTPPAAATERPRQRPGKEHVADSGHDGQNADTKLGWTPPAAATERPRIDDRNNEIRVSDYHLINIRDDGRDNDNRVSEQGNATRSRSRNKITRMIMKIKEKRPSELIFSLIDVVVICVIVPIKIQLFD